MKENKNVKTFKRLFQQDHTTLDYMTKYYGLMNNACEKVGITLEQGMKFLQALYNTDHKEECK